MDRDIRVSVEQLLGMVDNFANEEEFDEFIHNMEKTFYRIVSIYKNQPLNMDKTEIRLMVIFTLLMFIQPNLDIINEMIRNLKFKFLDEEESKELRRTSLEEKIVEKRIGFFRYIKNPENPNEPDK